MTIYSDADTSTLGVQNHKQEKENNKQENDKQ